MTQFKSDFLRTLSERGFIQQTSDPEGLDKLFATETVTAYIGFDPTAASLHVGSLIQIMMLHWLEKTGHRAVALMGGGTGMVGDPSFKDESRKLMTPEMIQANIDSIKRVFSNYLTFGDGPKDSLMLNNAEWLMPLNYLEFLRDVGQHFSVNRMLSFDSVKQRLDREQSLSFLEFNYMILQAYDFVELNKRYDVKLQMGGSDQWGNIVNGIDLGRRLGTSQLYALTSPLLTTASGAKMGKSLNGAIWLNEDMLPAYDFWQYWRNTEDADVERFLKLYTTLPLHRISEVMSGNINSAKELLATEVTKMLRGQTAANEAASRARALFSESSDSEDASHAKILDSHFVAGGTWVSREGQRQFHGWRIAIPSLLTKVGLTVSNSEARNFLKAGNVKLNDEIIRDPHYLVTSDDLNNLGTMRISVGRKRRTVVRLDEEDSSPTR
ncbi:MAG: tyrosine--tRNA ligase [Devosia sp.]